MARIRMSFSLRGVRLHGLALLVLATLPSCSLVQHREHADARPPMERAEEAWHLMAQGMGSGQVLARYNEAVAEVVQGLAVHQKPSRWPSSLPVAGGRMLSLDVGGPARHDVWQPALFDDLKQRVRPKPNPVPPAVRAGVGATLDGVHEAHSGAADSRFVFAKGQHLPVTAVIEFGKSSAVLRLYDPRETRSLKVGTRQMEVAADFASPVHEVLNGRSFLKTMVQGLFRPERFMLDQGLYLQEPYRADKVPVIFVHGLMSDPHIWENQVLALMSDPEIGPHVQCWCFMYPTGLPVASSSLRLRGSMDEARRTFDPKNTDPGFRKVLMVGHSMGGLLTRMQIEDSGNAFWNSWFRLPPDQVPLDGDVSRSLRQALLFKANPRITEVVFIATPHRGSTLADSWWGRLGARLIRVPQQIIQIGTSVATLDVEVLTPERLSLRNFGTNSVASLSSNHPFFKALNSRPMKAPCHSIIGNGGKPGALLDSSDGFVPYSSSHLDEAVSEKVIPYRHSCVEQKECAAEVTRIVREHLRRGK